MHQVRIHLRFRKLCAHEMIRLGLLLQVLSVPFIACQRPRAGGEGQVIFDVSKTIPNCSATWPGLTGALLQDAD